MKQKPIRSIVGLLNQSGQAISGAAQYPTLLTTNTETAISADRTGLTTALDNFRTGKETLSTKRDVLQSVTKTAGGFEKKLRGVLEEKLGSQYSAAWNVVGFTNSLQIPKSVAGVLALLEGMNTYLTNHEDAQVEDLNLTPARCSALVTDMKTAQGAVNTQRGNVRTLLQARRDAEATLRKRLRGLFEELKQKLDPLDGRWEAFGFNRPGTKETPTLPEHVTAVLVGETAAAVKWGASKRAEYYRVWKRVVGVDEEFVPAGSPVDRDFTIEGLPRNATIELVISAVNNGGESGKSTVVTVTTH